MLPPTCSALEKNTFGRSKDKVCGLTSGSFGPFDDKSGAAGVRTASARSFDFTLLQPGSHSSEYGSMIL